MKQWYYAESGQQKGPVDEQELKRLLETRNLGSSTLVWCEGMPQWLAADSIPELAPSPYSPPSCLDGAGIDWSGYIPSGPQARPWVRYWARTFDTLIFGIVIGIVLELTFPEASAMPSYVMSFVTSALYVLVEPLWFVACGTTPMKALLKVRVSHQNGARLSYGSALRRSANVWIRGKGLDIPIVSLVTCITSYSRLNNQGVTSWDEDGGFTVSHQEIEWWRWLILILSVLGLCALFVIGMESQLNA